MYSPKLEKSFFLVLLIFLLMLPVKSMYSLKNLFNVAHNIPLSLGLQIPNNSMKNSYGFVFEFTYLPIHSKS